MIEQIEEIGPETQAMAFAQLERLVESEIDILLRRPNDAVARRVAVERPITACTVRQRCQGIGRVG